MRPWSAHPLPCVHPEGGGDKVQAGPEGGRQTHLQGAEAQQQESPQLQANHWTLHSHLQYRLLYNGLIDYCTSYYFILYNCFTAVQINYCTTV